MLRNMHASPERASRDVGKFRRDTAFKIGEGAPTVCAPAYARARRGAIAASFLPPPVADLRHVLAVLVDVLSVLDKLVLQLLLEIDTSVARVHPVMEHRPRLDGAV
jgi:hypothetical protein